jgi:RimJ/RimL family protein N-acetyltransferase
MDARLALRPFREGDLPFLERLSVDPAAAGPYIWTGFKDPGARRRRWEQDGYIGSESTALAVVLGDDTVAGIASWRPQDRGGPAGGCHEIGLALLPEHRGRGLGTAAHALLVTHLFDFTLVHRLEAITDAKNLAEQRALERVGFQREGLLRGALFRQGAWQDLWIYGLVREDHARARANPARAPGGTVDV